MARLGVAHMHSRKELLWPARVLWDVDVELRPRESLQIVDTAQYPGQVLHYPGWRRCRYLPLEIGGRYATGLTVYCDANGCSGMSTHVGSGTDRTLGCQQGLPVHFALGHDERVDLVALCTIEMGDPPCAWYGPYLLVSSCPCVSARLWVTRSRSALPATALPSSALRRCETIPERSG